MELFSIYKFKQVNLEIIDPEFYDLKIDEEEIEIELNFEPIKRNDKVEVFFHIRYHLGEVEDNGAKEIFSVLHADFVSSFQIIDNNLLQKKGKKDYIDLEIFKDMLGKTISMSRGYLTCQTKGSTFEDLILPIISSKELIDDSSYKKKNLIQLQIK